MDDKQLKKFYDAIMTAESKLFEAEYELRKILAEVYWFNDEDKGILLDFMKCYLQAKKYNYDNVVKSINLWINKINKEKVHENNQKVHS